MTESAKNKDEDVVGIGKSRDDDLETVDAAWWEGFPKRWVIVFLCFSAFLLCNMDRVNPFLSPVL